MGINPIADVTYVNKFHRLNPEMVMEQRESGYQNSPSEKTLYTTYKFKK